MGASVRDTAWLEWMASLMGAGSQRRSHAALPTDQFHCLLDELPLHLVPQQARTRDRFKYDLRQQLFLNPDCFVLPAGKLPEEIEAQRHLVGRFDLQNTVAWVRDRATCTVRPFWLGSQLGALVSGLRTGEVVNASVPENVRFLLAKAGILTTSGYADRRVSEWTAIINARARTFREKDYVPLGGLIHPFHIAALRRYYRNAVRQGRFRLGDITPGRYVAHNESVARFFHHQLTNMVSAIVGDALKPSYVYFASYLSGAELKKHTDRPQCEISVNLCLDFSPEPELATSWPLRLDTPAGSVAVYQALGDALIYRGIKLPHYRLRLAAGHTSTSIFFHYVREDFSGSLD
jgi:hypothetical protein